MCQLVIFLVHITWRVGLTTIDPLVPAVTHHRPTPHHPSHNPTQYAPRSLLRSRDRERDRRRFRPPLSFAPPFPPGDASAASSTTAGSEAAAAAPRPLRLLPRPPPPPASSFDCDTDRDRVDRRTGGCCSSSPRSWLMEAARARVTRPPVEGSAAAVRSWLCETDRVRLRVERRGASSPSVVPDGMAGCVCICGGAGVSK